MEFNEVIDLLNETAEVIYEQYLKAGKGESPRLYDRFLAVSNAVDLLNDQAQKIGELEEEQPKWIPSSEKLPDEYDPVLVWSRKSGHEIMHIEKNGMSDNDVEWANEHDYSIDTTNTWWMPLIEPPEDGDK